MIIVLWILLGLIVIFFMIVGTGRIINAQKYKIRSETGIQKSGYITIGRIEQYVQVRGQNAANPIIIVLHGGPGNNMAYYSYRWQANLEQDYTIIHWDQRGCGNTYYHNQEAEKPTFDLLLSDLDELVDHVCAAYYKDHVVVMGHSWGTVLGGIYAAGHPDKVSAYIGVGQFNDVWNSECCAADEAARLAKSAGKTVDARKIDEQFGLVRASKEINMRELLKLRQLTGKYLPAGKNTPFSDRLFSPYMTLSDFKWFLSPLFTFETFIGNHKQLYNTLYSEDGLPAYNRSQYEVPVVILAGDCDWITPYSMARKYFESISAPEKEWITLEGAGHIPFMQGRFTDVLQKGLKRFGSAVTQIKAEVK